MQKQKVLVIVGPTASGKTSLSINLAKKFNGEVISADSRQVYRDLDLGTGKVTHEEMSGVPHHLLDVADPTTVYTASDFVRDGRKALDEIISRDHLPIVAGGSFFYVDALLGRITLPEVPPNPTLRTKLETMTTEELFDVLKTQDPHRASLIDAHNKPRLIRALEIHAVLGEVPPTHPKTSYDTLVLGIALEKDVLQKNIHDRILSRIEKGMVEEVEELHKHGLSFERMDALGLEYRYISEYLKGKLSYDDMLLTLETKTRQFAKRQMTWLKRDKEIEWVDTDAEANIEERVRVFLEK